MSIVTTGRSERFALIGTACLSIYLISFVKFIPSTATYSGKGNFFIVELMTDEGEHHHR